MLIARLLLQIAIIFCLPCVAAAETPLTNEQIITNFKSVTFGNEYTDQQYGHARKWKKPILGGILDKPPDSSEDIVLHFWMNWSPQRAIWCRWSICRALSKKEYAKGLQPEQRGEYFSVLLHHWWNREKSPEQKDPAFRLWYKNVIGWQSPLHGDYQ